MSNTEAVKELEKLRKQLRKKSDSVSLAASKFAVISDWIDTGDFGLNRVISGDIYRGIPSGRITILAGVSQCVPRDQTVTMLDFKDKIHSSVPIGELQNIDPNTYRIDSPDGWVCVGDFVEKGELPCYKISTINNHYLTASEKHLVQLFNNEWVTVKDLQIGDEIQTVCGNSKIITKEFIGNIECVDIMVLHPNHRYYTNGIVSHNTGKSLITAKCVANALIKNNYDYIAYLDSEAGLVQGMFGQDVDMNKIEQIPMYSIEDFAVKAKEQIDMIRDIKQKHPDFKAMMIADSVGMLSTEKIIKNVSDDKRMPADQGSRAKMLNSAMQTLMMPTVVADIPFIIQNHVYADPTGMGGKVMNQSGGNKIMHSGHVVIQCTKAIEKNHTATKKNAEQYYGATILKFFIIKNRIVKPYYETEMYMNFTKGAMYPNFGLFKPAVDYGLIKCPTQGFYTIPSISDKKYRMAEILRNKDNIWDTIIEPLNEKFKVDMAYCSDTEIDELEQEFEDMVEESVDSNEN